MGWHVLIRPPEALERFWEGIDRKFVHEGFRDLEVVRGCLEAGRLLAGPLTHDLTGRILENAKVSH